MAARRTSSEELEPPAVSLTNMATTPEPTSDLRNVAAKLSSLAGIRIGEARLLRSMHELGWIYRDPRRRSCGAGAEDHTDARASWTTVVIPRLFDYGVHHIRTFDIGGYLEQIDGRVQSISLINEDGAVDMVIIEQAQDGDLPALADPRWC